MKYQVYPAIRSGINTADLSSPLKISSAGDQTMVAPSLKPSTGPSANRLTDSCPSFKVL